MSQSWAHANRRLSQLEEEKAKLVRLGRERGVALDPDAVYEREATGKGRGRLQRLGGLSAVIITHWELQVQGSSPSVSLASRMPPVGMGAAGAGF